MGDNTERATDKYEWNVVLDCAVYPMVYRMERIEEERTVATAASPQQQQQQQPQPQQLTPASASVPIQEDIETSRAEETSTSEEVIFILQWC